MTRREPKPWIVTQLSDSATGEPESASSDDFYATLRAAWDRMVQFNAMHNVPPYEPFPDTRPWFAGGFVSYCSIPGVIVKQNYEPLSIHVDTKEPPSQFGTAFWAPNYFGEG